MQEDGSERDPAEHFEEYCDNIEETAAWGGQIELQALAQAIERHILVHCAGLPVVEQGMEYKGKHTFWTLLETRFRLGNWYLAGKWPESWKTFKIQCSRHMSRCNIV